MKYKLSMFNFNLPEARIAKKPAAEREEAKLMIVHKDTGEIEHKVVNDLKKFLGDSIKFETWERVNPDDKTKKSKIFHNDFIPKKSNGLITVGVYNYSKSYSEKTSFNNHTVIAIYSEEFNNFLDNE